MANETSIGGQVKAAVVTWAGVSGRVFRSDKVPQRPTFPYVTFLDPLSDAPELSGDCSTIARARTDQVDLWQKSADEDPLLPDRLVAALDGIVLPGPDVNGGAASKPYGCRVVDLQRIDDPDDEIVHHALTLRIVHGAAVVS